METNKKYYEKLNSYQRIATKEISIGDVPLGGSNPIRIQSMTTTDTMDTIGTVEQTMRMVEAGCEYVRITAPSKKEAENLASIKKMLREKGCKVPLIADIHFTPNAAEIAARIVEKVRVNPGNYADRKRFDSIEYTDESYNAELERIHERFSPLVKICKEYGTTMRIGTNHGSLSDRIMSRYGDTPLGMVESAYEFLRICEDLGFYDIIFSMKASNTQVMVQAYRLLMNRMLESGQVYPIHLGVTEAGEGEDGRIKSAIGIGTLLLDGIGDTVRVSLTEEPEYEMPVAHFIVNYFLNAYNDTPELPEILPPIDPYSFSRRETTQVHSIGGKEVPRVIADISSGPITHDTLAGLGYTYTTGTDKWNFTEMVPDYLYVGMQNPEINLPGSVKLIYDYSFWKEQTNKEQAFPFFTSLSEWNEKHEHSSTLNFVSITGDKADMDSLRDSAHTPVVLLISSLLGAKVIRSLIFSLISNKIKAPVILQYRGNYSAFENHVSQDDNFLITAACHNGELLIDGLLDGFWMLHAAALANRTAFGLLQGGRLRASKTEYISCPSCGRTLFDLQETTEIIRKRTAHLKGVKVGIMGCIVNGPGEMADADYGYVGSGPGKITLYKGKSVVEKSIPTNQAVDKLIDLIKEDDRWVEVAEVT